MRIGAMDISFREPSTALEPLTQRCVGETRFRPVHYGSNHTVRCQKDSGHDGLHSWKQDRREVMWGGEAKKMEDNTRFRFGLGLS